MVGHRASFTLTVPPGDDRERLVCDACGHVSYENPKVIVGSVSTWQGRILMAKRAIPPRIGYWTLPAGYLELGETAEAGAVREAWEEARARITLDGLLAVYSIPRISQIQLVFRARLESPDIDAGPESQAVALYDWSEIPWDTLAFPSVRWALHHAREVGNTDGFAPRGNPPGEAGDY
ncbi:MAG: NUDIX domain-containing protein [Alphaproteobacteria bacterium]